MGCHGSPTCQIEFDGAKGWLIGTANRGLNHMFTFINTSRVGTAVQAATEPYPAVYGGHGLAVAERVAAVAAVALAAPVGRAGRRGR